MTLLGNGWLLSLSLTLASFVAIGSAQWVSASSSHNSQLVERAASLRAVVAKTLAKDEAAAAKVGTEAAVWPANVAEYSSPIRLSDHYVAVVAYGFDPRAHPVQVMRLHGRKWSVVAAFPPPKDPGTANHPDSLLLFANSGVSRDVQVARPSGRTLEFLVPFAGGGCATGPVLSNVGGTWHYISFTGGFPTTEVMGGNPRFDGKILVTDNDCAANVASPQRTSYTWRYDVKTLSFVSVEHSGWPPNP
jgi:hypothetical protein